MHKLQSIIFNVLICVFFCLSFCAYSIWCSCILNDMFIVCATYFLQKCIIRCVVSNRWYLLCKYGVLVHTYIFWKDVLIAKICTYMQYKYMTHLCRSVIKHSKSNAESILLNFDQWCLLMHIHIYSIPFIAVYSYKGNQYMHASTT